MITIEPDSDTDISTSEDSHNSDACTLDELQESAKQDIPICIKSLFDSFQQVQDTLSMLEIQTHRKPLINPLTTLDISREQFHALFRQLCLLGSSAASLAHDLLLPEYANPLYNKLISQQCDANNEICNSINGLDNIEEASQILSARLSINGGFLVSR